MKYIKYITMVLLVGLFAACSDKDVTYDVTKADSSNKAFVQIFNMAPIANSAANYAYMVDINGFKYQNNLASTLLPRNGVPSGGTNLFFTVDAGALNIKLHKKENVDYVKEDGGYYYIDVYGVKNLIRQDSMVYVIESDGVKDAQGNVLKGGFKFAGENLEGKFVRDEKLNIKERFVAEPYYTGSCQVAAGKRYHVFIHNMDADPVAIEVDELPAIAEVAQDWPSLDLTDYIGEGSNCKFYNFLYESTGAPFGKKLQTYLKNPDTGAFDIPYGEAIGYGEGTKWKVMPFKKSIYNSMGYGRVDYNFHVIGANGADEGVLTYGTNNREFTDYWTYYVGRAYVMFIMGVRDGSGVTMATPRWTYM